MKPTPVSQTVKVFLTGSLFVALGVQTSPYFYKQVFAPHAAEYSEDLASMSKEDFIEKMSNKVKASVSELNSKGSFRSISPIYKDTMDAQIKDFNEAMNTDGDLREKTSEFAKLLEGYITVAENKLAEFKKENKITKDNQKDLDSKVQKELAARENSLKAQHDFYQHLKEVRLEIVEAAASCETEACKKAASENPEIRKIQADMKAVLKELEAEKKLIAEQKEKLEKKEDNENKTSEDDKDSNKTRTEKILAKIEKDCRDEEDYKQTVCLSEGLLEAMERNVGEQRMDLKVVEKFFDNKVADGLKDLLSIGMAPRIDELQQNMVFTELSKETKERRKMVEAGQKLLKNLAKNIPSAYSKIRAEVVEMAASSQTDDLLALSEIYRTSKALEKSNPQESLTLLEQAQRSRLVLDGQIRRVESSLREGLLSGRKDGNLSRSIFTQLYNNEFLGEINPYIKSLNTDPYKLIVVNENGQVIGQQISTNGLTPLVVNADGTVSTTQAVSFRGSRSGNPGLQGTVAASSNVVTINGKQYVEVNNGNSTAVDTSKVNFGQPGTRQQGFRGARSN